jgi:glutaredoxin
MVEVVVYGLEVCPNCEELKKFLKLSSVLYKEKDMATAEGLTEITIGGVFTREAPVLRVGEKFYPSKMLFKQGKLDTEFIGGLIKQ